MAVATAGRREQPGAKCPALAGLAAYLRRCGGRDTLHFDTVDEAAAAARTIRALGDQNVNVDCQYMRVVLSIA